MENEQSHSYLELFIRKLTLILTAHKKYTFFILFLFILGFTSFIGYTLFFTAPKDFPVGGILVVEQGDSLQLVTVNLKNRHIIKSEVIFRSLVILFGGEKNIIAGDYLLDKKEGVWTMARRFSTGDFRVDTTKITIPEGWNIFQIASYLEKNLIDFDTGEFIEKARKLEGYLFPDTYFVPMSYDSKDIIELMNDNYKYKITTTPDVKKFKRDLKDIVIMASILEGEALPDDRKIVAGILWKRISIGMPLQVDTTFKYINGKNTYELTSTDLKIDSPYNTYLHKGLPPGPISNPGIHAIISAGNPEQSPYLYFLMEKDGTIHYAKTFAEHIKNKEKYLK